LAWARNDSAGFVRAPSRAAAKHAISIILSPAKKPASRNSPHRAGHRLIASAGAELANPGSARSISMARLGAHRAIASPACSKHASGFLRAKPAASAAVARGPKASATNSKHSGELRAESSAIAASPSAMACPLASPSPPLRDITAQAAFNAPNGSASANAARNAKAPISFELSMAPF
jgi:hypothetical protein